MTESPAGEPKQPEPAPKVVGSWFADAVESQKWSNPLIFAGIAGIGVVIMLAWNVSPGMFAVAAAVMVAATALAVGGLLGFLFGIPRSASDPASKAGSEFRRVYQDNTNLEQVSDWLTKIVIALGLAQLNQIPAAFKTLADFVATSFGTPGLPPSLVGVVLAYFAIVGFLTAYLWTRLYLTGEFTRADKEAQETPEFLEGLIQALLYQPAPRGYTEAIRRADEYRERYGDGNWRIWRSLACAYGQLYASFPPAERATRGGEAREKALAAVTKALELNPGEKQALRGLWDPSLVTPEENDLVVFFPDNGFKAILGS
jgi:hypothetical protein